MNQIFGAHLLMMKPNEAISVPEIATIRHPNLLVSALAIGPAHVQTIQATWPRQCQNDTEPSQWLF